MTTPNTSAPLAPVTVPAKDATKPKAKRQATKKAKPSRETVLGTQVLEIINKGKQAKGDILAYLKLKGIQPDKAAKEGRFGDDTLEGYSPKFIAECVKLHGLNPDKVAAERIYWTIKQAMKKAGVIV